MWFNKRTSLLIFTIAFISVFEKLDGQSILRGYVGQSSGRLRTIETQDLVKLQSSINSSRRDNSEEPIQHERNGGEGNSRIKQNVTSKSNVQSILVRLNNGNDQILYTEDPHIILLLGNTGAGKSTLAQLVAGNNNNLKSVPIKNEDGDFLGLYTISDIGEKIGLSTIDSHTEFPELVFDIRSNTTIYDCPGFSDTRDAEHDISGKFYIKNITMYAKAVKLIFVVNYNSVSIGGDRADFMLLATHATNMIRDINKFKNGVAIVATKVNNEKLSDNQIIKGIANFIARIKLKLDYKTEKSLKEQNIIHFIEALLTKNGADYTRIGFVRQPNAPGAISGIAEMQENKRFLERLLHENVQYVAYDAKEKNFGYTVSADSKLYVNGLVKQVNQNILSCVRNIVMIVNEHYTNFVQNISNKIDYMATGQTIVVGKNLSEIQSFSLEFCRALDTVSTLVEDIKHVEAPQDLWKKINVFANKLNVKIPQNITMYLNAEVSYLEFFYELDDVIRSPHSAEWNVELNRILKTLEELKNSIHNSVSTLLLNLTGEIKSNIKYSVQKIEQFVTYKEKTIIELKTLNKDIESIHEKLDQTLKTANNRTKVNECIQQIRNDVNSLSIAEDNEDINSAIEILNTTIKLGYNYEILSIINIQSTSGYFKCADEMYKLIVYLSESGRWYCFLIDLFEKLSSFKIQSDTSKCVVRADGIIQTKDAKKIVVFNTIESFLNECSPENNRLLRKYDVKKITINESKFNLLKEVLDKTLKSQLSITCDHTRTLAATGRYVKLSDVVNHGCTPTPTSINIFALNKVFIDSDFIKPGVNVSIIAPIWEIQGLRKIILDGEPGAVRIPAKATHCTGPEENERRSCDGETGFPGGSGGNFLGVGQVFVNAGYLSISANGGSGGRGQDGGDSGYGIFKNPEFTADEFISFQNKSQNLCYPQTLNGFLRRNCNSTFFGFSYNGTNLLHFYEGTWKLLYNYVFFPTNCIMADGGSGGSGGEGGNSGKFTLIAPLKGTKLNGITASEGSAGSSGIGGRSDLSYIHGKTLTYIYEKNFNGNTDKPHILEKHNNEISLSCSPGKRGTIAYNGNKTKSQQNTEELKEIDDEIINKYKSYIEMNLIGNVDETDLRHFLLFLEKNMVPKM